MKFNKQVAERIKTEYGVCDLTIRNWKATGRIPDKYFLKSKIMIDGYTLLEARNLVKMNQLQVNEKLTELVRQATHSEEFVLHRQLISLWELGKNKPTLLYEKILTKFYQDEFERLGIKPKTPTVESV